MIEGLYKQLTNIEFWMNFIEGFKNLGPLAPIFLALIESIIPALPLVVIVAFNGSTHGALLGFFYSWIGSTLGSAMMFLFYRHIIKRWLMHLILKRNDIHNALKWVGKQRGNVLFLVCCFPFTPSSFINLIYGLSDYNSLRFIKIIVFAKFIMVSSLALFGNTLALSFSNPIYIVLAIILLVVLIQGSGWIANKTGISVNQIQDHKKS